LVRI
jgi:hypothetical protein